MLEKTLIFTISLLGKIPLGARRSFGRMLGELAALIPMREKKIALLQLALILPEADPAATYRRMMVSLAQTFFESFNLAAVLEQQERFLEWDLSARFDEIPKKKLPAIFLSAHCGNWDLLAAAAIKRGHSIYVVGREARLPILQSLLDQIRKRYGTQTLWRGATSARTVFETLRQKHGVAALIDQDLKVKSLPTLFFGRECQTSSSLVEIAKRVNAVIFSSFIFRKPDGKFLIEIKEIDAKLSVQETLNEFNRRLEMRLKQFPDQWVWFHKRWRTLPNGAKLSSAGYIDYLTQELNAKACLQNAH